MGGGAEDASSRVSAVAEVRRREIATAVRNDAALYLAGALAIGVVRPHDILYVLRLVRRRGEAPAVALEEAGDYK
jgi:hypothetical protein